MKDSASRVTTYAHLQGPRIGRTQVWNGARVLALAFAGLIPALATADAVLVSVDSDRWQFAGSVYLWLADVGGKVNFPAAGTSADFNVDAKTLLSNLNMGAMGAFDAHKGRWGLFTDVMYFDVGGGKSATRDFTIGNLSLPAGASADLHLDVKAWIWTLAGEYRVLADPDWTVDLLAGGRYIDVDQGLNWSISGNLGPIPAPGRAGSSEAGGHFWDAIIGIRGSYAFGEGRKWSIPFYLDGGAGQSDYTYQAALGVGYSFQWGQLSAMWRYLDYKPKSGPMENLHFSGPLIGATFRW
jgi:hypothetical protein